MICLPKEYNRGLLDQGSFWGTLYQVDGSAAAHLRAKTSMPVYILLRLAIVSHIESFAEPLAFPTFISSQCARMHAVCESAPHFWIVSLDSFKDW
jgi:hypothetical protein